MIMTARTKNLAKAVVLLPVQDRAFLAERLLASLEETEIEQEWMKEPKRRQDAVRSGQVKPLPAEEVYRRIDQILGE